MKASVRRVLQMREVTILGVIIVLVVLLSFTTKNFLSTSNIANTLLGLSGIAIVSIGMTMVIVTGGIDVSVGSALGLASVVAGKLLMMHASAPVIVVGALVAGFAVGILNGAIISYGNIPPIIVTLGTMNIIRALLFGVLGGRWVSGVPRTITPLGLGRFLTLPIPFWISLVLIALFSLFLASRSQGRAVYAMGNNADAARVSGVNLNRTNLFVYAAHRDPGGNRGPHLRCPHGHRADELRDGLRAGGHSGRGPGRDKHHGRQRDPRGKPPGSRAPGAHPERNGPPQHPRPQRRAGHGRADHCRGSHRHRAGEGGKAMKGIVDRVIANRMIFLAVLFVIFFVFLSVFVKDFFTLYNLTNMTQYAVELGLLALAETFVILSGGGGIDLSVGSIMSLAAMVIGVLIGPAGLSIALAVPLGLIAGTLMGYVNGILISYTMIPPLIVTLATMYGYSSLALLIAVDPRFGPNPTPVSNFSDAFYFLGQFRLFEIPFQVLSSSSPLVIVLLYVLNRTAFGRRLDGVAATTGGPLLRINVRRVRISVYTLSGLLCALGGWIITSRVASARPDIGSSFLLEAITIAVLGGVSIKGGEGTIGGVVLALVIITMLYNGMDVSGIQPIWQLGILGVILVVTRPARPDPDRTTEDLSHEKNTAGILVAFACASAGAQAQITVAATQSLSTSGFLSYIGALAQAGSGVTVRWEPAENGQVIQLARECGVDAILASAPAEEEQLVRDGVGALRLRVMTGGSGEQFDVIAGQPRGLPDNKARRGAEVRPVDNL